ncbi:hypothetical protein GGI02_004350 [Coemansia sp. RSA 2322]|nr:hypothetical protein GGI02_004350 [Coemansia sp. RSA 2322]
MTEVSQLEHSDDVNAESGADIDMSFVPALLTATSDGIFSSEELCSDGCEFQFVLADDHADLGFVAAQAALEPGGNTTPLSEDEQEDAYLASLYRRGVVFDNVNQLQLPAIAPGSVYRLELPLYILHSGMYEISYAVHDSSACLPLDDKKTAVLAQGTLNIESSIGFTDSRSSDS